MFFISSVCFLLAWFCLFLFIFTGLPFVAVFGRISPVQPARRHGRVEFSKQVVFGQLKTQTALSRHHNFGKVLRVYVAFLRSCHIEGDAFFFLNNRFYSPAEIVRDFTLNDLLDKVMPWSRMSSLSVPRYESNNNRVCTRGNQYLGNSRTAT